MKFFFDDFFMKNFRSENSETRFWANFDMSKVSELQNNCPEGAFCVGRLKIFGVRAFVRPSVRPFVRSFVPSLFAYFQNPNCLQNPFWMLKIRIACKFIKISVCFRTFKSPRLGWHVGIQN